MRELILSTNAVASQHPMTETVSLMKEAIANDPNFQLLSAETIEKPDCTYVKMVTECALNGSRGEEYYQHKGFTWPKINFFVNQKAEADKPFVYARSADPISEDLCPQATNLAARVIDAADVSPTKIQVVTNYKALALVAGGILLFALIMGILSL